MTNLPSTEIDFYSDLLDSRDIIARRDELQDMRKPWLAMYNLPGYMPDAEPASFETWAEARDYLAEIAAEEYNSDKAEADCMGEDSILAHWGEDKEQGEQFGRYHFSIQRNDYEGLTLDEFTELEFLRVICEDGEKCFSDWEHGETLVASHYFETYTQELVEECGYISKDFPNWIEIDWEATARNVRIDYTPIEIGPITFWGRS